MGRKSVRENKSVFQLRREELGLSREKACDRLGFISSDRLLRIENGEGTVQPDEVLDMSKAYQAPWLCNHYCSNECAIGRKYVPKVEKRDLSAIVLQMVSTLNAVAKQKDLLIDIAADGQVDDDEYADFENIQNNLEKLSVMVESLQLWTEQMQMKSGKLEP